MVEEFFRSKKVVKCATSFMPQILVGFEIMIILVCLIQILGASISKVYICKFYFYWRSHFHTAISCERRQTVSDLDNLLLSTSGGVVLRKNLDTLDVSKLPLFTSLSIYVLFAKLVYLWAREWWMGHCLCSLCYL